MIFQGFCLIEKIHFRLLFQYKFFLIFYLFKVPWMDVTYLLKLKIQFKRQITEQLYTQKKQKRNDTK